MPANQVNSDGATDAVRQIFSANLKHELERNKLTQRDFCEQFNARYPTKIRQTVVSQWLLQKSFPRTTTLQNIADYFNVSVGALLTDRSLSHVPLSTLGVSSNDFQNASTNPNTPPLDKAHQNAIDRVINLPAKKLPLLSAFLDVLEAY